ncbi:hypothetical protein Vretimale_1591 [Volvox reticuliferus]|nr:hypothetical protein Vretifemale_10994 [Volvox reticuliferus]GIL95604.1 hypothetical protein Vretimale_1591 [Volvox reticuliferus]
MWNSWSSNQPRASRKRKCLCLCPRKPDVQPWMTGITVGPSAWEPVRAAAAAVAATANAAAAVGMGISAKMSEPGDSRRRGGPAAARMVAGAAQALHRRPVGQTLYVCCYSVPGLVAFDATTLLPLGVFITFNAQHTDLAEPEGVCASQDHLYVLSCQDCTVARIGLQTSIAASLSRRHRRYGGPVSYGHGIVLAKIVAGVGWVSWGLTLAPDGSALYCAVDRPYEVRRRIYTHVPPPRTSGNVICVPLECLGHSATIVTARAGGQLQDNYAVAQDQQRQQALQQHYTSEAQSAMSSTSGQGITPYVFVPGPAVLRRPSGLRFSPDGSSLWVTSYDGGVVELAGPVYGALAGTVLRVVPLPLPAMVLTPPPVKCPDQRQTEAVMDTSGPSTSSPPLLSASRGSSAPRAIPSCRGSGRRKFTFVTGGLEGSAAIGGCVAAVGAVHPGAGRVMLAWDLCWVPQDPPVQRNPVSFGAGPSDLQLAGVPAAAAGSLAVSADTSPRRPLLCMTLHEDPSQHDREPSGWECRAGVLVEGFGRLQAAEEGEETKRRQMDHFGSSGRDVGCEVAVRVRWRVTREHLHPSMACVV